MSTSNQIVNKLVIPVNLTVRNIPDELLDRLRTLTVIEKRSLNTEILFVLEKGLAKESEDKTNFKNHLYGDPDKDMAKSQWAMER